LAVHQGVETGIVQAESHMGVPALTQVLDRVAAGLHRRLLPEVEVEAAFDDGIDEALFAAEEVIQRRHLDTDGIADGPQGEVLARSLSDEVGSRIEQPGRSEERRVGKEGRCGWWRSAQEAKGEQQPEGRREEGREEDE